MHHRQSESPPGAGHTRRPPAPQGPPRPPDLARPQTLTETPAEAATPLAVGGRTLPSAHASLASILASRLGQAHRDLLATPSDGPDGSTRWTTALPGEVQAAGRLAPDARSRLERRAGQLLGDIEGLGRALRGEGATGAIVGQMLELAVRHPPGDWLYSVDGKPVLVLWGHDLPSAAAAADGPSGVRAGVPAHRRSPARDPDPANAGEAASPTDSTRPAAAAASSAPPAGAAPRRWPAVLGLLLLAAGLAALLFGLRGCAPSADAGPDPRWLQAEAEGRQLEAELARRRNETPRVICAAPPPEPAAPAPEPPAEVASAPPPAARAAASAPPACPGGRPVEQAPQVAIVFDTSPSMNYSLNASKAETDRAEREWQLREQAAAFGLPRGSDPLDRVRGEPRRITPARQAAVAIAGDLPGDVGAGLVLVGSCRDGAKPVGFFEPARRGALLARLHGLKPPKPNTTTGTPLADGLAKAARMVDGVKRDAMMLVISDGEESCGGDPCATAAAIARARPRLRINVLDITGTGAGNCVARATGGRVFTARNAPEVASMMKRAAQDAMAPADCR